MKKLMIKPALFLALFASVMTSCVSDDDAALPPLKVPFYSEKFQDVQHNTILDLPGWTNFNQAGNIKWKERIYQGDGYAEFNTYGSGDLSNIAWLISPSIDISGKTGVKFSFDSAQNFVSNASNTVEVYVSTDYNGTDVATATWTRVDAKVADAETTGYLFVPSGEIDLGPYEAAGHVYIAFKAIGSGTNTALDGLFEINNLYVYTSN
ncbi:choice-of-anchor J domain-containing protein [Flavobacterium sp. 3HN19-14]|uniref:choice-of-anchor J domain-containing protein n=1 Tax=Flavobacterium sp. 3HN19-14 TaxID=3448133 RepID=UPI003EE319A3